MYTCVYIKYTVHYIYTYAALTAPVPGGALLRYLSIYSYNLYTCLLYCTVYLPISLLYLLYNFIYTGTGR
jgi:hypothetical protein